MPMRTTEYDAMQRPRQIRRRMIVLAKLQGPHHHERWIPARAFLAAADDLGEKVRDEDECDDLLSDLLALALLEEWQPMGLSGKQQSFAQRRVRLTHRGYALWSQELDPIPEIADERLGD